MVRDSQQTRPIQWKVHQLVTRAAIAIIDDDENVRISLDSLLRACGYRVQLFESAEHFLNSDAIAAVDCLVSDIQMPGMSGVQMYQQLLNDGYCMPVIFITASADQTSRRTAQRLGACCYLSKPFESEELVACLNLALNTAER